MPKNPKTDEIWDPYLHSPYCILHNTYLGKTKNLFKRTIIALERRKEYDNITIIATRIQNIYRLHYCQTKDEVIRSLFTRGKTSVKNILLQITKWNGKEWRSFTHIALLVFRGILPHNELMIWYFPVSY